MVRPFKGCCGGGEDGKPEGELWEGQLSLISWGELIENATGPEDPEKGPDTTDPRLPLTTVLLKSSRRKKIRQKT